ALREGLPEHRLRPLRAEGEGDDAAPVLLLQADRLLEGVLVRPVHLVIHAVPPDVLPVRRDLELEVRVRDLLHAYDEVQGHCGGEIPEPPLEGFGVPDTAARSSSREVCPRAMAGGRSALRVGLA